MLSGSLLYQEILYFSERTVTLCNGMSEKTQYSTLASTNAKFGTTNSPNFRFIFLWIFSANCCSAMLSFCRTVSNIAEINIQLWKAIYFSLNGHKNSDVYIYIFFFYYVLSPVFWEGFRFLSLFRVLCINVFKKKKESGFQNQFRWYIYIFL